MKKYILFTVILISLISLHLAWAAPPATMPETPDTSNISIWTILENALNWFFGIALIIAVIMLIYAGFTYITSSGNEEKIKIASKTIIFALIGVAIALLARGIPDFIQNFLLGKTSSNSSGSYNNQENIANTQSVNLQQMAQQKVEDCNTCGQNVPLEDFCSACPGFCCADPFNSFAD